MLRHLTTLYLAAACLISLLFGVTPAAAETMRSFECESDGKLSLAEAKEAVKRVQSEYATVTSLRADFLQSSYSLALDESSRSNGLMWFSRPGRMKWHYRAPEEQIFVIRDDTLWFYQVPEKQVVIDKFTDVLISELPVAFLMGIGNLQRDFAVKGACRSGSGTVIQLEPASKKAASRQGRGEGKAEQVSSFKLLVNRADFPIGASVSDVGGNITSIMLSEIRTGAGFDDAEFGTVFPRGTDVIDHRKQS